MRRLLPLVLLACSRPGGPAVDWSTDPDAQVVLEWPVSEEAEEEEDNGDPMMPVLPPWLEWPIEWGPDREQLTAAYMAHHRGPEAVTGDDVADSTMVPRVVILHWTGGPTAASAWHTFNPTRTRRRHKEDHQKLNVSAHFVVERDGTTYRLLDETKMGRHAIGMNHLSVGIENVGDGKRLPLTTAQVAANVAIVRWLAARYPLTHLIGHYETRQMEAHPYFEETDPRHRSQRLDPGPEFMALVRAELADLGLQGPPTAR